MERSNGLIMCELIPSALPAKKRQIQKLVEEGRLEFTSGTWVMVDEATPHLYSMLDQMIEGNGKTRNSFCAQSMKTQTPKMGVNKKRWRSIKLVFFFFPPFSNAFCTRAGHQWLKSRLGVSPKSAWTVDPFGHGPVAPYLLHAAGLQNTVVQRIHYGNSSFKKKESRTSNDFLITFSFLTHTHTK